MSGTNMVRMMGSVALIGLLGLLSGAQAATPSPDAAAGMQAAADNVAKQGEQILANAEKTSGEVKTTAVSWGEAVKAQAAAMAKLSAALASGDDMALTAARAELDAAQDAVARAQDRFNVRQNQWALAPNDRQVEVLRGMTSEANKPLFEALVVAKQKAIEAGNTFVAAITPEAPWNDIEAARDNYIRSVDALELANRTMMLAIARAKLAARVGEDKLAELTKNDEALLAALQTVKEQMLQARILERKRATMVKELETAPTTLTTP